MQGLLAVFHSKSRGNFYHNCTILSTIARVLPKSFITVLISQQGSLLFPLIFNHLHEPPVLPLLEDIYGAYSSTSREDLEKISNILVDAGLPAWVEEIVCGEGVPEELSNAGARFLVTHLEHVRRYPSLQSLLVKDVMEPDQFLTRVCGVICNWNVVYPAWQRTQCVDIICSVLKVSQTVPGNIGEEMAASQGQKGCHDAAGESSDMLDLIDIIVGMLPSVVPFICQVPTHTYWVFCVGADLRFRT